MRDSSPGARWRLHCRISCRTRWHADPDRRLRGLLQGLVVGARGTSPMTAEYIVVLFRMYGVFNVVFGLMAIAIAVTAFRRGERWAWWALLVGNTIALGVGDDVRPDRERHRTVRAVGIPRPRPHLRRARRHRAFPCRGTASSIDDVAAGESFSSASPRLTPGQLSRDSR